MGRRVRWVEAESALGLEGWRVAAPPEVRDRDIVRRRRGNKMLILTAFSRSGV